MKTSPLWSQGNDTDLEGLLSKNFSPSGAAKLLGVSVKTIHRWDQAGKLRCTRTSTVKWYVSSST